MKRFIFIALALMLVLSSFVFVTPAAAAAKRPASVYVIHGIPGQDLGADPALPVDILVNDTNCLLKGFTYKQIAGPVPLPEGTYNFKISLANAAAPCTNAPVITADVPFVSGEVATVIAHLTEAGAPTASKFVNDTSILHAFLTRLTVRHTAAAPTVDIGIEIQWGDLTFATKVPGLSNPNQAGPVKLPPFNYMVKLYPANEPNPVFGPVDLKLRMGRAYFVYAVGSFSTGSFDLIVHTIGPRR